MSRPVKWPPTITRHSSGLARVRVNGRDVYLGKFGSEEAKQRYAALLLELSSPAAIPTVPEKVNPLLVCDILARWLIHARSYYSERGREQKQYAMALRPMERLFGLTPASSFGAAQLRQLQQAMLSGSWLMPEDRQHHTVPKSGGWARRTVNTRIIRVRTVWRWAEENALVPGGSWEALRAVQPVRPNRPGARDSGRRKTTTLTEVKLVSRRLTPALRALLLVQFWTGARSGELREMRAGDIDTSGGVWVYRPRTHKTAYLGHHRAIWLGPRAQAALAPFVRQALLQGPDGAVFPSRSGDCYSVPGLCHAMRKACLEAGLPDWRPYTCRHAARVRLSARAGDEHARSVLGHKHLDTSLIYGGVDEQLARDAAARFG